MLTYEIIRDENRVQALADEWRELYTRAGRSPFSNYDIFMVWWQTIGKTDGDRTLYLVTGRIDGKLVAVLPLTVVRWKGLRIMQAAGYRAYNYCDMLAEDTNTAAQLWQAARKSPHYDFADIRDVYPHSFCDEALKSFARSRDLSDAFFLEFKWPTGEDWIKSLSSHARGDYRRCMRHLEKNGSIQYEIYKEGPLPTAIIDSMVKQKIEWAQANKKPGLFYHPNVLAYFHQSLADAAARNNLFLAWLKSGDNVIAYNQGFIHDGIIHLPFWTFDPAFARYSPGKVMLFHSMCWAIDNGLKGLDLRQGGNQIKRTFANEKSQCAEFTFSGSLRGRLLECAYIAARSLFRLMKGGAERLAAQED